MLIFLLLLIAAGVVVGFFVAENGGNHDFVLFNHHFDGYAYYVPILATAVVLGALLLLTIIYGRARIGSLRRANLALRDELAGARSPEAGGRMVGTRDGAVDERAPGRFGFLGRRRRREEAAVVADPGGGRRSEGETELPGRSSGAGTASERGDAGTAATGEGTGPVGEERVAERHEGSPQENPDLTERLRGYGTEQPATQPRAGEEGYGADWPRRDEPAR